MIVQASEPPRVRRMRRDLREPIDPPAWPAGTEVQFFLPGHALEVHALLMLAYESGGGSVAPFSVWWPALASDTEFDPALCILAQDAGGRTVGVAQCWTSAFVKDLAVHPGWRRRGLGRALLLHAFSVFKQRGAETVDLKVEAGNLAAVRLYRNVRMREA